MAASFAEIEGTAKATSVFGEMTRILKEQGVDEAVAYVSSQQPAILERVKARAAAVREQDRAELLPLLKGTQLQASQGHSTEAADTFEQIISLEPDWPEALDAHFWFLTDRGDHAMIYETLDRAMEHFKSAQATAEHLRALQPETLEWQRDLSVSYDKVGDVKSSQGDLPGALASYQAGLEIRRKLSAADPSRATSGAMLRSATTTSAM